MVARGPIPPAQLRYVGPALAVDGRAKAAMPKAVSESAVQHALLRLQSSVDAFRTRLAEGSEGLNEEAHRELDRVLLPLVMEHTRGNQYQAAKILGVARQTLRRRLRELHITPRFTDTAEDDTD